MRTYFKRMSSKVIGLHGLIMIASAALLVIALIIADWIAQRQLLDFVQFSDFLQRTSRSLPGFYDKELRSDFFIAFISVGTFLLSLKTFIVITMKKELFDTASYEKLHGNMSRLDPNVGPRYKPLRDLNDCLFWSILTSMITAVAQTSVGFVSSFWVSFFCIWLAVVSCLYLLYSLLLVKRNLDHIIPDS